MSHVVVDPVTRIEGHLRIEAEVEDGAVKDAWSSSTMFRGIEIILKGRDPRDAWVFTQRICGVCTTVHAIASIRAVEDAIGAKPPPNARLLRNLIIASQCVQDHVIHFYHLHALDWVDVVSALEADPGEDLAAGRVHLRLAAVVDELLQRRAAAHQGVRRAGQLGPFANAYWGHKAYKLPPEANLMAVAHYLEALDWQREFIKFHAILGGKNPHLQSFLVGGMATPVDPDSQAALNVGTIAAAQADHQDRAGVRLPRATSPTSWRSRRSTRTGRATARGVGNYLVLRRVPGGRQRAPAAVLPFGRHPRRRPRPHRGLRRLQDHGERQARLVRVRRRRRTGRCTPGRARPRRSSPGPSRPYERLNTDGQVLLAQVAAL